MVGAAAAFQKVVAAKPVDPVLATVAVNFVRIVGDAVGCIDRLGTVSSMHDTHGHVPCQSGFRHPHPTCCNAAMTSVGRRSRSNGSRPDHWLRERARGFTRLTRTGWAFLLGRERGRRCRARAGPWQLRPETIGGR